MNKMIRKMISRLKNLKYLLKQRQRQRQRQKQNNLSLNKKQVNQLTTAQMSLSHNQETDAELY
jgi:hypothetical protein